MKLRQVLWKGNKVNIIRGILLGVVITLVMLLAGVANAQPILLGTANTVTLRGEINDDVAQAAALELMHLNVQRGSQNYTIYLVLDTPGGSIEAGENLIEVVKTIPNVKTITIFAASMGSAIVQALPGERLMLSSGIQMFHRASGRVGGQFETGELESRLDFYKKFVRRMEQRSADRMQMSLKEYKKRVKDEMWLTSSESLELKAADKVVSVTCTEALTATKQTMTMEVFIFKINLEFSGCPLLRAPGIVPGQDAQAVEAFQKYRNLDSSERGAK